MAQSFDVCIRGDGIVGRTLALHLASHRMRVALVQAQPPAPPSPSPAGSPTADVRAYALNRASRHLLEAVRCWPDAAHATAVQGMQIFGDAGAEVAFQAQEQSTEALNWVVDVPVLEGLLADAVRFQPLITAVSSPTTAALTVVCEGKHSQTRAELGVEFSTTAYDQWALATRVESTVPHQQMARQWFGRDDIVALLPLDGPQGHSYAVVWSAPPARAQTLQTMENDAFCTALEAASHHHAGSLRLLSARHTWPLHKAQAQRWCGHSAQGAWVLAGDAAHTVHPLAGQGLNLGLGDVAELVRILSQRAFWRSPGDARLLRQYERARKAELWLLGGVNDGLQQLFAQPHSALQYARNMGMRVFNRSGAVKHWVAHRAMGSAPHPAAGSAPL
jgi:2-polyprenyl-6-methoxyphenol hydroxylase-like FAD-dependent oxidoreductase